MPMSVIRFKNRHSKNRLAMSIQFTSKADSTSDHCCTVVKRGYHPPFIAHIKTGSGRNGHEPFRQFGRSFNDTWDVNSQLLNISEMSHLINVQKPKMDEYLPPTGAMTNINDFMECAIIYFNILFNFEAIGCAGFIPVPVRASV